MITPGAYLDDARARALIADRLAAAAATARRVNDPFHRAAAALHTPPRVVVFEVQEPPLGLISANGRYQHFKLNRMRQQWRENGCAAVARSGWDGKPFERARVDVVVQLPLAGPGAKLRDIANITPTVKAAMDGLVSAGVIGDDDDKHITGPFVHPTPDGAARRLPWAVLAFTFTEIR